MNSTKRGYRLEWETQVKGKFKSKENMPFRREERDRLAHVMSFDEINQTLEYDEDSEKRRKRKWIELHYMWKEMQRPEHKHGSVENALWRFANVEMNQFISALVSEFKFVNMGAHLKKLYLSLDGGTAGHPNWQDIVASHYILSFFRLVRDTPIELLLHIFDVYATPVDNSEHTQADRTASFKTVMESSYIDEYNVLLQIFLLPTRLDSEVKYISDLFEQIIFDYFKYSVFEKMPRMMRATFRLFLKSQHGDKMVQKWSSLAWNLLPTESRLAVLDEAQLKAIHRSDVITERYKYGIASNHHNRVLWKKFFIQWVVVSRTGSYIRRHVRKKYMKRRKIFFKFWMHYTQKQTLKRRRQILAEVMGAYTIKARFFHRIRLFNYTSTLINKAAGKFYVVKKQAFQGFAHLREFRRLWKMRKYFHKYWNQCVILHNEEVAMEHRFILYTWKVLTKWHQWAKKTAHDRRMEYVAQENQMAFQKMMEEADNDVKELVELEKRRIERKEAAVEEIKKEKKAEKREKAKAFIQSEREKDRVYTLTVQRNKRRQRVRKTLKQMKKKFTKQHNKKTIQMLENAKARTTAYLENKESALAIDMKFEKLKREFFVAPTDEWQEREKILTSPKNIVFLYLEKKMELDGLTLESVVMKFGGEKGYLTYDEFRAMVSGLKIGLTPHQVNSCIRNVDDDGDGFLDMQELRDSMKDTCKMGVMGSDWKLYIDPAQDVICYHNFLTGEKVLEYSMTDEKLREIHIANYYGEARYEALQEAKKLRAEGWEEVMKNHMAQRLQYMYRQFKCRKQRKSQMWSIVTRNSIAVRAKQRKCVKWMERYHRGARSRLLFAKQLRCVYEKVWDIESGRLFWLNHQTNVSTWERPALLWRYGDVEQPSPWVSIPESAESDDDTVASGVSDINNVNIDHVGPPKSKNSSIHFWHVTARKSIPRKPDGLLMCQRCEINLALRNCYTCGLVYCFSCHRDLHRHPLNFLQHTRATELEASDASFLELLKFHRDHIYGPVEGVKCDMCKSENNGGLLAAFKCVSCGDKNMCRPCYRRLHEHKSQQNHEIYTI